MRFSILLIVAAAFLGGCSTTDQEKIQDQIDDWRGKHEQPAPAPEPIPDPQPDEPVIVDYGDTDYLLEGAEWWCKQAGSVDECGADFDVVCGINITDRRGDVVWWSLDPKPANIKWGVLALFKWTVLDSGEWGFRGGGVDGTGSNTGGAKTIKNNGIQYRHSGGRSRSEVEIGDGDHYAILWVDGKTGRRSSLSQVFRWPNVDPVDPARLPGNGRQLTAGDE